MSAATMLILLATSVISGEASFSITDKRGVVATIEPPIMRAVFHINYELIPALGIWDRVVGLGGTAFSNDLVIATKPVESTIPTIGDIDKINVEKIIELKPDIVITWSYSEEALEFIERAASVPVVAYFPDSLTQFYEMLISVGTMFGKREEAESTIREMENVFDLIRTRTSDVPTSRRKRILWLGGKPTVVCGKLDSRNDIIHIAGGVNPAESLVKNAGEVSIERLLLWNPDVVIITWHAPYSEQDILNDTQLRHMNAVRCGRVYKAPPWSTWSPRLAPIALWMASKAYPERFRDVDIDAVTDVFFRNVFHIPFARVHKFAY